MDNRYCNARKDNILKRQTLRSLFAGLVFFAVLFILTKQFSASLCPIYRIFGIRCLGCGMTRGFISILALDFQTALAYNILSVPLFVCLLLYTVFAITDIIFNKNFIATIEKQLAKKYMFIIYFIILTVGNIINNL